MGDKKKTDMVDLACSGFYESIQTYANDWAGQLKGHEINKKLDEDFELNNIMVMRSIYETLKKDVPDKGKVIDYLLELQDGPIKEVQIRKIVVY